MHGPNSIFENAVNRNKSRKNYSSRRSRRVVLLIALSVAKREVYLIENRDGIFFYFTQYNINTYVMHTQV